MAVEAIVRRETRGSSSGILQRETGMKMVVFRMLSHKSPHKFANFEASLDFHGTGMG